ncbi:MAG: hypothetical protein GXO89_00695 [Chlorobi bacterium]|nr:hypothetical protein [Chlorobiota bacterium]
MVLIHTHKTTNRIKFIFNLFFKDLLNVDFEITSKTEDFEAFEGTKFSYGKTQINDELFFASGNILFERGIASQQISLIDFNGSKAFFQVYNKASVLEFDPFAAAFYLVSRYEEYLPYRKDNYGRYSVEESLAHKSGFLQKPLVNQWALHIGKLLMEKYPGFQFPGTKYKFVPTIDIDAAWAYKHKGFFRILGGLFNAALHLDFRNVADRLSVLGGFKKDPFDTFTYQFNLQKKHKLKPIYFILFAEYGFNDKNIPVQNRQFQTLIKSIADYAEVGIHPSYGSHESPKKLRKEVESLSKVLNREITKSRQHFLKLLMPTTYRNLINLDITDDYSMGFAGQPGFRAGICSPFNFYDLDLDIETHLRIHPFTMMEGTLRDYMGLEPEKAMEYIKDLIKEVKAVNGTFISLWHNESLGNEGRWKGWQKVYEEMIKEALPDV